MGASDAAAYRPDRIGETKRVRDPCRIWESNCKYKTNILCTTPGLHDRLGQLARISKLLSNPDGIVTGIRYNGVDNLLEILNEETNRGYWDLVWNDPPNQGKFDVIKGTSFEVINATEDQVEVSFKRPWDPSLAGSLVPLNIDKRFIVLGGSSGFYTYAIYEHLQGWPGFGIGETRIAFKLRKDKFRYMAMADNRQRVMPMPEDRLPPRGQPLAYPEAVLLVNPTNPDLKGEVDDKYQYSTDNKDNRVHGWISADPPTGFWVITPSDEFKSGGPVKQNLTSHVGPTALSVSLRLMVTHLPLPCFSLCFLLCSRHHSESGDRVFLSSHYTGDDLSPKFQSDEQWKKVFGPIFIYFNSTKTGEDLRSLWDDAKTQMVIEVQSWPYSFPLSQDLPSSDRRGSISGQLLVKDRYLDEDYILGDSAYVGLAPPGDVGSWQRECKGYQFWTRADANGYFSITNIRIGDYNLFAWVPGVLGDYKYETTVTVSEGSAIDLGVIIYEPPRDGPTLWEIGIPDRTAFEFHIPDPNPSHVNKLFINHPDRFRQYGLWERYSELYPDSDLVYTVESSDYQKDWFFAQVNRKKDNTFLPTTWQVKFHMDAIRQGTYKLRVAIASATLAELQVRFNDPKVNRPHFTTGLIGRDNSIARHGIHGLYWLFNIDAQSSWLVEGENTIFLTQPRATSPFQGILYDYIRFEAPPSNSGSKACF